jgi:hypothetical protein
MNKHKGSNFREHFEASMEELYEELGRLRELEKVAKEYCDLFETNHFSVRFKAHLKPKSLRPTGEELREHWDNRPDRLHGHGGKSEAHTAIFLLERLLDDYSFYSDGFLDDLIHNWIKAYRRELEGQNEDNGDNHGSFGG